jgi:signal transduction histidine kinase
MSVFLHASVRDSLRIDADRILASLDSDEGRLVLPKNFYEPPDSTHPPSAYTERLVDRNGIVLFRNGQFADYLPAVKGPPAKPAYSLADPDLSVYSVPVTNKGTTLATLQVARSTEAIEHALKQLFLILAFSLPFFLPASAAGGYLLVSRLLRPIDLMTRTARRISAEDLSARIGLPETDDELGRLASTFDEMLARIENSFERHKRFTADASHELRTPVSVMKAIISVTRKRRRSPEEYEQALEDLEAVAGQMGNLVNDLLALSRSDLNPAVRSERVDLGSLLSNVAESLRSLAEAKGISLSTDIQEGLFVEGDGDALTHLALNLLDNAVKYTKEGGIRLSARSSENKARIEIADSGIGIAREHLPMIFDRFYRVDQSRSSEGTGLGLSIAQAIVRQHRGTIEVRSEVGRGTTVIIQLPPA